MSDLATVSMGQGGPATVLVHGLAGSGGDLRHLAGGLTGTRILLDLPGHGASPELTHPWTYTELAEQVGDIVARTRATRAVGVSLGAGVLLALMATQPNLLERVVLLIPAALDDPRSDAATARLERLGGLIDRGDVEELAGELLSELPTALAVRALVRSGVRRRAEALCTRGAPWAAPGTRPVADRLTLRQVTSAVLVVGQQGDPLHPAAMAREVAGALPRSELVVLDTPGVENVHRHRVRRLAADHLADGALLTV